MTLQLSELSNGDPLLRALYKGSLQVPVMEFAVWALGQISAELNCSGVLWEIQDAYGVCAARRTIGVGMPAEPPSEQAVSAAQQRTVVVTVTGASPGLKHDLSYFREHRDFSAAERRLLQRITDFLPHAEFLNQQFAMRLSEQNSGLRTEDNVGTAMVSLQGYVHWANTTFRRLLRAAHRNWGGISLPFSLDWSPEGPNTGFVYRDLYVWGKRIGDHFELRIRKDQRLQTLSPREYEISTRVAKGLTFKEISGELKIAPSTVSSHLYNLYDKLGIRRRAELIEWLNLNDPDQPKAQTTPQPTWSL